MAGLSTLTAAMAVEYIAGWGYMSANNKKKGQFELQPGQHRELAPGVTAIQTAEGTAIKVSTTELPEPPRAMSTNWCDAIDKGSSVELIFGQMAYGGVKLSAALVVSIGKRGMAQALFGTNPTFVPGLAALVEKGGHQYTPRSSEQIQTAAGTERTVFEAASIAALAYSDDDAEIRFYRVSPHDVSQFKAGRKTKIVYPVVQIDLATHLMYDLCKRLSELLPQPERA